MTNNYFNLLKYNYFSDIGKHRLTNEDAYLCLHKDGFYVVADGMGGGSAGDIASLQLVENLNQKLKNSYAESPGERKTCLQTALLYTHKSIQGYSQKHNFNFMGTTVAGIMFNPWNTSNACIFHAGDSRIYRFRKNNIQLLTSDHTVENELSSINKKLNQRFSGILTHAIGIKGDMYISYSDIIVEANDLYLICTDGVSRTISDKQINKILNTSDFATLPNQILRAIEENDGKDNATAIFVGIPAVLPLIPRKNEIDIAESNYLEKKVTF